MAALVHMNVLGFLFLFLFFFSVLGMSFHQDMGNTLSNGILSTEDLLCSWLQLESFWGLLYMRTVFLFGIFDEDKAGKVMELK